MSSTLLFRHTKGVLIGVHAKEPPSEAEWSAWVEESRRRIEERTLRGIWVVTEGGGPHASQRAMLSKIPGLAPIPTAIVTNDIFVRGIVTALSWVGKNIRAFAPTELEPALAYLRVPANDRSVVMGELSSLRQQLGDQRQEQQQL